MYKITLFPGDGIGVEVTEQAEKLIREVGKKFHLVFEIEKGLIGGASIDKYGEPMTAENLEKAKKRLSFDELFILQLKALQKKWRWQNIQHQEQKQIPHVLSGNT